MISINIMAVLVAAVAAFVIGFLAHGPVAGKLWMRLANVHPTGNEKLSDMYGQMAWNLVANIVTAYALAVLILLASGSQYFGTVSVLENGLLVAFVAWAGFLVASSAIGVIWMKAPIKLWIFENVSSLIAMLVMGAIIALW